MNAAIYVGDVMHARFAPKRHVLRYRVFNLLLDVDHLDHTQSASRLFSVNRFNLFSFHERDHGPANGSSLRHWAELILRNASIDPAGGSIQLLCFPRVLGYAFNPLSVWYCRDREGKLQAVIHEVRNTFGERHSYLVARKGSQLQHGETHNAYKIFHVSPFMPMAMRYRFRIAPPGECLDVLIDEHDADDRRVLRARLKGVRRPFTDAELLKCFLLMPLMTFKVITMIHWQALRMLLRGFRIHRKPVPPANSVSETWPTKVP